LTGCVFLPFFFYSLAEEFLPDLIPVDPTVFLSIPNETTTMTNKPHNLK